MFSIRRLPGNPKFLPLRGFGQTRNVHCLNKKRWSNSATPSPEMPIENHVAFHGLRRHLAVAPRASMGNSPHQRHLHTNQHSSTLPALTLRDMCTCPQCIDPSTRQKLFSTAEIPPEIEIKHIRDSGDHLAITWENDILRNKSHESIFSKDLIGRLLSTGSSKNLPALPQRRLWNDKEYRAEVPDLSYEAYMQDDAALYKALQTLQSHGMVFLEGVPEATDSVARLANRIGPLKNTFYGDTWDVRSVPNAKNVAYTSQDLGFHMDLLYMKQPPHLQLLHCIRSSTEGGASLFTDSFKAIKQLYEEDREDFATLQSRNTTFHYDHIDSHYYQQSRPLIELAPLKFGSQNFADFNSMAQAIAENPGFAWIKKAFRLEDYLDAVSWSPPFQAPYQLTSAENFASERDFSETLESTLRRWHSAARKLNEIIHEEENIYERTMKPGECVIFDNRRVLHARRAFEVADAGKERWLRGAYTDKDPFLSKLRVLANRYKSRQEAPSQKAEAAAA